MARALYSLHIPADHLSARLQGAPAADADLRLASGEQLHRLLLRQGIVHGLDEAAIARAQEQIDAGEALTEPIILAAGTPPVIGRKGLQPLFPSARLLVMATDESGQSRPIELLLTPLVRKGETVAGPGPPVASQTGRNIFGQEVSCPFPAEQVIEPGEHVTMHADGQHLVATVSGYPRYVSTPSHRLERLRLGIDRLIKITPDRMQAVLYLIPPPPGHALPDRDTIVQVLDEEQVVFGRLPQAIDHCLERCGADQRPRHDVVALGALPVNGKDAWLRFAMEVGSLPGKIMGNGEIDFRERNMFIGVTKNQLIAQKIPATDGIAGRDLYGTAIAPAPGKDIVIRTMDDAALDEATGEIRALRNGVLSMVTDNSVRVCSHHVVAQDVDFETGNIVSRDAVDIRGSIRPKFKVSVLGDVLVGGDVDKAMVRSDGNVVIKGGVIGKFATVQAHGDIDVAFVIQGRTKSGGKTVLRRHGSYCRLHASGDLHCSPSALIIASQLVAYGSVTTGAVGSDIAPPSLLAAAVVPDQLHRYFELRRTIEEQTQAIERLRHRKGSRAAGEELEELLETHEANRRQFARLNLAIPKEREADDNGLAHALACTIVATGKVFAGTEIRIGNSRMTLPMTVGNVCFRLQQQVSGEAGTHAILIIPNKRQK